MKRYCAKLLFQFRLVADGNSKKRRLCEERLIIIRATSAKVALAVAKQKGRLSQYHYCTTQNNMVYFEFVGVMELLRLGLECECDEVWYDIHERLLPMERKENLIPLERDLHAIHEEKGESTVPHQSLALAKAEKYKPASLRNRQGDIAK